MSADKTFKIEDGDCKIETLTILDQMLLDLQEEIEILENTKPRDSREEAHLIVAKENYERILERATSIKHEIN